MTGVVFIREDDGRVTARHIESDVASFGDTDAEALRELADALEGHFGARASDNGSEEDTDE